MAISTERKTSIHELADHGQSLWLDNLTLVRPEVYGDGRLFTYIRMQQDGEHPGITSLERLAFN